MTISKNDTICAIATPAGRGGIGVVRISGPMALEVLKKVWMPNSKRCSFSPRKLYLGQAMSAAKAIDTAMAVYMPAPSTYTGEDVVEISTHGSPAVLAKVLEACIGAGARLALGGEFTRRAFLSGKIDLAQAEAVLDVISAGGERALRQAEGQLNGELSNFINKLSSEVAEARASLEAGIDFPDEDDRFLGISEIKSRLQDVCAKIRELSSSYAKSRVIKEGLLVAIVGRPNVGKSSVFNIILGEQRAIVHSSAGTTRDVVEADVTVDGVLVRLKDTAGLRETSCEIEAMGTRRSLDELSRADVVLVVIDGSQKLSAEDVSILNSAKQKPCIVVVNKSDLEKIISTSDIVNQFGVSAVSASALQTEGVSEIKTELSKIISSAGTSDEGAIVASARHKAALDEANENLNLFFQMLDAGASTDIAAQKLRAAHNALMKITGECADEKMLDEIFSRFCIGK